MHGSVTIVRHVKFKPNLRSISNASVRAWWLSRHLGFPASTVLLPTHPAYEHYVRWCYRLKSDGHFYFYKGFKDIMSTAKTRLSFGERAVFWLYDKIREWSRMWLTHFFLLFISAGYCAAGALIFQAVEGRWTGDGTSRIFKEREQLIANISKVSVHSCWARGSIAINTHCNRAMKVLI